MAILSISSVIDKIRKLSGNVHPALDARISGLVASFEAISLDSCFDDISICCKIRTLAYDIDLHAVLSDHRRAAPEVVKWVRRVFEVAALLDDYEEYALLFEEEYDCLRDEHLLFANTRRIARAEEANFLGNTLCSAVYHSGLSNPTVTARIDCAIDWTAEELRAARFKCLSMSAFAIHCLANAVVADADLKFEEMGGDDDSGADSGI